MQHRDGDDRQPRIVAGGPVERTARSGLPHGVALDDVAAGPAVRRLDVDRIVVALLAPRGSAPLAITTRATQGRDGCVDAVFQPTIARGPLGAVVPWSYLLRLPAPVDASEPLAVRIAGLGAEHVVDVPPLD